MRVLVISLFTHWTHHLGTEYELIRTHQESGDAVEVLGCFGDLPSCTTNMHHLKSRCLLCVNLRIRSLRQLPHFPVLHSLKKYVAEEIDTEELKASVEFENVAEAKSFRIDGLDVGYGATSSAIGETRDPHLEAPESKRLWQLSVKSYLTAFRSVSSFLEAQQEFDRVYIFNGRFAETRGAWRACQRHGVDVYLHERGADNTRYSLSHNRLPHDMIAFQDAAREEWESAGEDRDKIAREFFDERIKRVELDWFSFTKSQDRGRLPEGFDSKKKNICIFTSSDDELASIDESWENNVYANQLEGLQRIVGEVRKWPNVHLYIRMHPHLRTVSSRDVLETLAMQGGNVTVIVPSDATCTYTLLEASDVVLTFGSTVGTEATYLRRPSILVGPSLYDRLNVAYIPKFHSDVVEMLKSPLEPLPLEGALAYGYYCRVRGTKFKHYRALTFESGVINRLRLSNFDSLNTPVAARWRAWLYEKYGRHPRVCRCVDSCCFPILIILDFPIVFGRRLFDFGIRLLGRNAA